MSDEDDGLTLEEWLYQEMKRMLQELMIIEISYDTHQAIWGVPCGPTLSMVYPPHPRGLLSRFDDFDPSLPNAWEIQKIYHDPFEMEDEDGNKIYRY